MRRIFLALVCAFCADAASPVHSYVNSHQQEILGEFTELLAIPNVASDAANIVRNADAVRRAMVARGIQTRLLETPGAPPVILGELPVTGATRTLIFYAHYDGQPVDNKDWTITAPFKPLQRDVKGEPRLYGRSTSDDKAAIIAMLAAVDALKASNAARTSNLKFIFEGEEEAGSPHLQEIVHDNAQLLAGDVWLICDGPVYQNGQQQVYFGARGISALEITVFGPNHEIHSGHYGNWAPNPAMMLARLLASMKSDDGRILVQGFSRGIEPLSATEKRALSAAPDVDGILRNELGIGATEVTGRKLVELINEPSLNVNGLQSAGVGALARNVIPSKAIASIDCRLVKGMNPKEIFDDIVQHVKKQGYTVATNADAQPTGANFATVVYKTGYAAARTSMDLPISKQVVAAIEAVRGPVVRMPTLGGSVPLYIFEQELHAPMIGIPIANHDNNQHSANENIRLRNLWDGIETMAALMTMN